jgi:protein-tyrosine phosphatase
VIDLHTHVLPGLDDGPADMAGALALAQLAKTTGVRTLVATPHIRDDHHFPLDAIPRRTSELNSALAAAGVDAEVLSGGEVAISKAPELTDAELAALCLGSGPYLLVESPYTHAPELLENALFDLLGRGFQPILAHPERSPSFLSDFVRLARIVEHGVLCSVTAHSMAGGFGHAVRRFTAHLFAEGVVHNVASDAHDGIRRPPGLRHGFEELDSELPGLAEQVSWFTDEAPAAILSGRELPEAPTPVRPVSMGWRRMLKRAGLR